MNLIYLSHAKNQVRFGEKSEKKRFGAPWRDGTGGASPENEARAGGAGERWRRYKVGSKRLCEGECPRE